MPECKQCGECCRKAGNVWKQSPVIENHLLLKAMMKYKTDNNECLMLGEKDGKAICILHEVYGYDAKPAKCKRFEPGSKRCSMEAQ